MAQYRAFKAVEDEEQALSHTTPGHLKPTSELEEIVTPFFATMALQAVTNEARRRLRHTMMALFAYRQARGGFPAKLTDLPPAQPTDPFLGKPMCYRTTRKAFTVYSVGQNLTDDGGMATPAKKGEHPPDIVAAFPLAR